MMDMQLTAVSKKKTKPPLTLFFSKKVLAGSMAGLEWQDIRRENKHCQLKTRMLLWEIANRMGASSEILDHLKWVGTILRYNQLLVQYKEPEPESEEPTPTEDEEDESKSKSSPSRSRSRTSRSRSRLTSSKQESDSETQPPLSVLTITEAPEEPVDERDIYPYLAERGHKFVNFYYGVTDYEGAMNFYFEERRAKKNFFDEPEKLEMFYSLPLDAKLVHVYEPPKPPKNSLYAEEIPKATEGFIEGFLAQARLGHLRVPRASVPAAALCILAPRSAAPVQAHCH